jgi:hypothetical protein
VSWLGTGVCAAISFGWSPLCVVSTFKKKGDEP